MDCKTILNWQKIIEETCKHKGVSVYGLAAITGISEGYLGKLKNGHRHEPSINKAMQILKYHPDTWIVGGGEIKRVGGEKE